MHDELVVAVFVEALQARTVAAHAMHARRRIARELDPPGLQRMELRMNHGARERNHRGRRPVEAADDQAPLRCAAACPAKAAVSQPPSGLIEHSPSCMPGEGKDPALVERARAGWPTIPPVPTRDDQRFAIGMQRRRIRMDRRAAGQLPGLAAPERELEQLCIARAVDW